MTFKQIGVKTLKTMVCLLTVVSIFTGLLTREYSVATLAAQNDMNTNSSDSQVTDLELDAFDKHFSAPLYWENNQALESELNRYFNIILEKMINTTGSYHIICKTRNEYYRDSLKKLENGELTMSQILQSPEEHIWKMKFEIVAYEKNCSDKSKRYINEKELIEQYEVLNKNYQNIGIRRMDNWLIVGAKLLNTAESIEKIKEMAYPAAYAMNNSTLSKVVVANSKEIKSVCGNAQLDIKRLEKKYNEPFEWVGVGTSENGSLQNQYAPRRNRSIKFEIGCLENQDKYLTALAQHAMSEEVASIIKEEGYEGKIIYSVKATSEQVDKLLNVFIDQVSVDMSKAHSNGYIIDKAFKGEYQTTLSVVMNKSEAVDNNKLKIISDKIEKLCPTVYSKDTATESRSRTKVVLYKMSGTYKRVVSDMYRLSREQQMVEHCIELMNICGTRELI